MQQPENLQVVLLGMGTVFSCLVILIFIISIMGRLAQRFAAAASPAVVAQSEAASSTSSSKGLELAAEQKHVVAVISAALAEKFGVSLAGQTVTLLQQPPVNENVQCKG